MFIDHFDTLLLTTMEYGVGCKYWHKLTHKSIDLESHSILFPLENGYIARETLLVTQITLYGQT